MAEIAHEKYVALTTYKRDGTPKSLPVWIADFGDGTIGFTTSSSSYKVKRIRNDPRVELQPSNSRGDVKEGTSAVSGTAVVVTGAEFEPCREVVKAKYGLQYRAIELIGKIQRRRGKGSGTDAGVKITLD